MTKTKSSSSKWPGNSAIFNIVYSLQEVELLLKGLLSLYPTDTSLASSEQLINRNACEEAGFDNFCEIYEPIIMQECKIAHKVDLVCLMSSIHMESEINRFLCFNFEPESSYPAENMSASERLTSSFNAMNKACPGKDSIVEAIRVLFCWRNSYLHNSGSVPILKTNNILQPCEPASLQASLALLLTMVGAYIRVTRFLRRAGKNEHISNVTTNEKHVCSLIYTISQYCFDGNKWSNKGLLGRRERADVARIVSNIAISGNRLQKVLLENCLAILPSRQEQILMLESGLGSDQPLSHRQIIAKTGLSAKQLHQERSLALTSISVTRSLFGTTKVGL